MKGHMTIAGKKRAASTKSRNQNGATWEFTPTKAVNQFMRSAVNIVMRESRNKLSERQVRKAISNAALRAEAARIHRERLHRVYKKAMRCRKDSVFQGCKREYDDLWARLKEMN